MRVGGVCSGIGAFELAFKRQGYTPAFLSEIAPFSRAVLAHHFPEVPLYGDFTQINEEPGSVDVLVGGTPCRTFSAAGKREGLDHDDGKLAFEFAALAGRLRPRWFVFENVPRLLSFDNGAVFAALVQAMGDSGYSVAWRILDAARFGVPQRRRRLFVVGYRGDWRPAAAAILDRRSLQGPARQADEVEPAFGSRSASWDAPGPLAFAVRGRASGAQVELSGKIVSTIRSASGGSSRDYILEDHGVRRMTVLEAERLFGLPDHWTLIQNKARLASDTTRLSSIGLSVAVPVVEWLAERIRQVEATLVAASQFEVR